MHNFSRFCAAIVWAASIARMSAQQIPGITFTPSFLYKGSGATELQTYVILPQVVGAQRLGARWNGAVRPFSKNANGGYQISLTAEDLASPGLFEVTIFEAQTGATVAKSWAPVGYNVMAGDILLDDTRGVLYVSTPAQTGDMSFPGNSIVALNPGDGSIASSLAFSSTPGNLALSSDGSALYASFDAEGVVRRIDPDRFTQVSQFNFRPASGNFGFARSAIAVQPGNPSTVAVYYHPNTGSSATAITVYDQGIKRTHAIGAYDGYDGLLFSPDGKYIYLGSFSNFNSPQNVLRYSIDSSGIPDQTPATAAGGGPVVILNGVLYTSRGTLIKTDTMQVLGRLGIGGSLTVDPGNSRMYCTYFVQTQNAQDYPESLQSFDLTSLEPLGSVSLDSQNYFGAGGSDVQRLFRFASDGLIFSASKGLLIFHTPIAGPAPVIAASAIVNAASQKPSSISPGEIITIYGVNLGPDAPQAASLNQSRELDPTVANVEVWFDKTPGTVLLASKTQLNVEAPFELRPGGAVDVQVWNFGIPSARIPMSVETTAPALFTRDGSGSGAVVAINRDGTVNTPSPPGSIVTLYGTGGGLFSGATDGAFARSAQPLATLLSATIAGENALVLYAGAAPGQPDGVFQLNLQIPADTPSGVAPVVISAGARTSPQGVTIEIR